MKYSITIRRAAIVTLAFLFGIFLFSLGLFSSNEPVAHAMQDSTDRSFGVLQMNEPIEPTPQTSTTRHIETSNTLRYLALGDSYTIGESVTLNARFPVQLTHALRAQGLDIDDATIIARTGWTTDELDRAMDDNPPQGTYDLVTLLIGVNNQYRGRTAENYRPEFIKLLQRAIHLANNRPARVIVVSIPDWGATPFGRNRKNVGPEIDAFNQVNQAETARLGAHYIDITPISRQAPRDPALVASDELHPSDKMYSRWVELIEPLAFKLLTGS